MNIAIITGASSGLGVEFTEAIIERYRELDEIWIIARRKEHLEKLASKYPDTIIRVIQIDLSDDHAYMVFEQILDESKPNVNVLINNAGYEKSGSFEEMMLKDIQSMLSINIKGLTVIQRLCLPYMHKGSLSILTCSVSSFTPVPHQAVYSASKKYVYYFGKALREELLKKGINILLLCPGNMDTEMNPRNQMRQSRKINNLPFLNMKILTRKALVKAEKGKSVYTPGGFYKFYRIVSKIFPSWFVMKFTKRFY